VAGDDYAIRRPITVSDISKWGGTALTGRDISNDLAKLDVALSTRLADSKIPNAIPQEETTNEPKISINKDNVGLAKSTDISATQPRNITQVGGTAQTARDWSDDLAKLQNLDALLSTRATETTLAKIVPIAKAALFNTALPTAEANWLASDITPTNSPSYLRIYVCVSVAGVLRVARTVSATTITEDLNSGNSLVADAAYMFDVAWRSGDSINIRYSVTTGTIKILRIEEIGAAV
jgi:hypothetical protein